MSETIILHEDEYTLSAWIRPAGIEQREWPFPYLPKPVRLPSHLTTWQCLLTQSSIDDRTRCYRLINELREGLREMEQYMETIEEKERAIAVEKRCERIRYQREVMRQRREALGPYYKSKPGINPTKKVVSNHVFDDSSDDDFVKPIVHVK